MSVTTAGPHTAATVLVEPLGRWVEPADALAAAAGTGAFLLEDGTGAGWSYLAPPQPGPTLASGPLTAARTLLREGAFERPAGAPPFCGGLVGSLGYDLARELERLPQHAVDDLGLPPLWLRLVRRVVAFDHAAGDVLLCAPDAAGLAALRDLLRRADLGRPLPPAPEGGELEVLPYGRYRPLVERVLEHIARGDVYQLNLTHRTSAPCRDAVALYRRLRAGAPVPYGAFLDAGRFAIAGASPERFLRAWPDGRLETRPMKGTRPRGATAAEDRALAAALRASPKDRAENVMIVDLARNDLGRVCRVGSVHVPAPLVVERHPTVLQLVSTVAGTLAPDRDVVDAIAAAFPPGSMTGAPKVRAMELIEELEPVRRGPYAGAFGWIGPDGACDLAVVIRTAVVLDGRAHLHVGGGIVADSQPRDEYAESLLKARTVAAALGVRPPS